MTEAEASAGAEAETVKMLGADCSASAGLSDRFMAKACRSILSFLPTWYYLKIPHQVQRDPVVKAKLCVLDHFEAVCR